jgi:hypothetical protein
MAKRTAGRPESGRITITVRISPEERGRLGRAALAAGIDKSAYIRRSLMRQLKRDKM